MSKGVKCYGFKKKKKRATQELYMCTRFIRKALLSGKEVNSSKQDKTFTQ